MPVASDIQKTGRRYLIGAARSELKSWKADQISENDWTKVRDGVEAKLCQETNGKETFLLCRSQERAGKEKAMHDRFCARIEEGLTSLQNRLRSAQSRLEKWQEKAGLGNSQRTLLTELGTINCADVVLPLAEDVRRHLRIRCVVRPDSSQSSLLDRLGLRLPERLRLPAVVPGM